MNTIDCHNIAEPVPKYAAIILIGCFFLFVDGREGIAGGMEMEGTEMTDGGVRYSPLDQDAQWIVTINYVNLNSDTVMINYRVFEKGVCTAPAMALMESLRKRLAEKGFMYRKTSGLPEIAPNHYSVLLGADTQYSIDEKSWKKKEGNLMVLIMSRNVWEYVDVKVSYEKGLTHDDIEGLTADIMERLEFRSLI